MRRLERDLRGGGGVPEQISQSFPALGAGVAGQVGEEGDGLLAVQTGDGYAVQGEFRWAEQVELECGGHCFAAGASFSESRRFPSGGFPANCTTQQGERVGRSFDFFRKVETCRP